MTTTETKAEAQTSHSPHNAPPYIIARDGHFFRVVHPETGWRSSGMGAASMAGLWIRRKAGYQAEEAAAAHFLKNDAGLAAAVESRRAPRRITGKQAHLVDDVKRLG